MEPDSKPTFDNGIKVVADLAHDTAGNRLVLDGVRSGVKLQIQRGAVGNDLGHAFQNLVEKLEGSKNTSPPSFGEELPLDQAISSDFRLYSQQDLTRIADLRSIRLRNNPPNRRPHSHHTSSEYGRIVHSMAFRRLQGKMQLFPPVESPLLRNRLTHSLEVTEIAANIVKNLNDAVFAKHGKHPNVKNFFIDTSIVATAALAHDLGHPPFGHSGEMALNEFMCGFGGFEGNAQSLRLITRIENRLVEEFPRRGSSIREVFENPFGLNLLFRTIASVIKYDSLISNSSNSADPKKGYYEEDRGIVDLVKKLLLKNDSSGCTLRTIECQIMDLADDIAYSTYDLEDCFISGTFTPADFLAVEGKTLGQVVKRINKKMGSLGYSYELNPSDVQTVFFQLFDDITIPNPKSQYDFGLNVDQAAYVSSTYFEAKAIAKYPLLRRRMTESLINNAIRNVSVNSWNTINPCLTRVDISPARLLLIECLKAYNYVTVITSSRLQIYQHRSFKIVKEICNALYEDDQNMMLPTYTKELLQTYLESDQKTYNFDSKEFVDCDAGEALPVEVKKRRFISDYVASLTDAEAMELYAKLTSADYRTIFGIGS